MNTRSANGAMCGGRSLSITAPHGHERARGVIRLPGIVGQYREHASVWGNNQGAAGLVISVLAFVILKLALQLPRTDKWIRCFDARSAPSNALLRCRAGGYSLAVVSVVPSLGEGQHEASRVHQPDCWFGRYLAAGGACAAANGQGWRVGYLTHRRPPTSALQCLMPSGSSSMT